MKIMESNRKPKPIKLIEYSESALYTYGSTVVESRAICDYRDGLKPVQRRILWAMHKLRLTHTKDHKKSARVVGETLGKYHPHGDLSCYSAMVSMSSSPHATVDGHGNWGGLLDNAASSRYTNCRLSKYSDTILLNTEYMPIVKTVPNYDGKEKEPFLLPALLPNILLNGCYGIAFATTTHIPSYHAKGIQTLLNRHLSGKKITPQDCVKHLKFKYTYGGILTQSKDNQKSLLDFYNTGKGSIKFESNIEIKNRQLILTGFAPGLNAQKSLAKASDYEGTKTLTEETSIKNGYRYVIELKSSIPKKAVDDHMGNLRAIFSSTLHFVTNITIRKEKDGIVNAKFRSTNIPKLLSAWVKWRLKIEEDMLIFNKQKLLKDLKYQNLMELVALSVDSIYKSLQKVDSAGYLVKKLDITLDEAELILDLKVRRLKALELEIIRNRISTLKSSIEKLDKELSDLPKTLAAKIKTVNA